MKGGFISLIWLALLAGALVLAGCCVAHRHGHDNHGPPGALCANCPMRAQAEATAASPMAGKEGRQDPIYVCNCGPDCTCKTVSMAPGACPCGKALKKVD